MTLVYMHTYLFIFIMSLYTYIYMYSTRNVIINFQYKIIIRIYYYTYVLLNSYSIDYRKCLLEQLSHRWVRIISYNHVIYILSIIYYIYAVHATAVNEFAKSFELPENQQNLVSIHIYIYTCIYTVPLYTMYICTPYTLQLLYTLTII